MLSNVLSDGRFWSCVPSFVEVSIPVVRSPDGVRDRLRRPFLGGRDSDNSRPVRSVCCRAADATNLTAVLNVAAQQRENAPVGADEIEERGAATNPAAAQHRDAAIAAVHAIQRFRPVRIKSVLDHCSWPIERAPQSLRAEI